MHLFSKTLLTGMFRDNLPVHERLTVLAGKMRDEAMLRDSIWEDDPEATFKPDLLTKSYSLSHLSTKTDSSLPVHERLINHAKTSNLELEAVV